MKRWYQRLSITVSLSLLLLSGCLQSETEVRIVNALPQLDAVDVNVAGSNFLEGFRYLEVSTYTPVESGSLDISVLDAVTDETIFTDSVFLVSKGRFTVVLVGETSVEDFVVIEDTLGGFSETVRFIHAAPSLAGVDLISTDGITMAEEAIVSGLNFSQSVSFASVFSDDGELDIQLTSSQENLAMIMSNSLPSIEDATLILVEKEGGGEPFSVFVVETSSTL